MFLDIKTTGRIVLYCPVNDVYDAKKTFVAALTSSDSFENLIETSPKIERSLTQQSKPEKFRTLPNKRFPHKHSNSFSNTNFNSLKHQKLRSNSTIMQEQRYPQHSRNSLHEEYYVGENGRYDVKTIPARRTR